MKRSIWLIMLFILAGCSGGGVSIPPTLTVGPLPTLPIYTWRPASAVMTAENGKRADLLGALNGHTATVNRFSWSPDHRLLFSIDASGEVRAWDLATGNLRYKVTTDSGLTQCFFSKDGNIMIAVGNDARLYFVNVADGGILSNVAANEGRITSAAIAPGGLTIATAGKKGEILLWDISTRAVKQTIKGLGSAIQSLLYSPDGSIIVGALGNNQLVVWDSLSGAIRFTLNDAKAPISQIEFSDNGKVFVVGSNNQAIIYDTTAFTKRYTLSEDQSIPGAGISVSPDGYYVSAIGSGDVVYVWQLDKDLITTVALPEHRNHASSVTFSPNGAFLISTIQSDKGGAYLWEVSSFKNARQGVLGRQINQLGNGVFTASWSPDGKYIALADVSGGITVWGIP